MVAEELPTQVIAKATTMRCLEPGDYVGGVVANGLRSAGQRCLDIPGMPGLVDEESPEW
jgi:hypothetical protein